MRNFGTVGYPAGKKTDGHAKFSQNFFLDFN